MAITRRRFLIGSAWTALALGAGGLGWWFWQRPTPTPHEGFDLALDGWAPALRDALGSEAAARVREDASGRFDAFWRVRPSVDHHALNDQLAEHIVPAAAIFTALERELGDSDAAYERTRELFAARLREGWEHGALGWLDRIPGAFDAWRLILRDRLDARQPDEGYSIEWVRDDEAEFSFTVHRCFHVDAFAALELPDLARLSCEMDLVMYESLPESIGYERSATLAEGAQSCAWVFAPEETG